MQSDLKYAVRMLVKAPGFALVAVLTLALGIGANSAIFSVIHTVLLRPLPFPNPHELVAVWSKVTGEAERETNSFPDYADIRDQSASIRNLAAYTLASAVLNSGADSHELHGVAITSDIFATLGISPLLGRTFNRDEEKARSNVVVLGYDAWRRYFNSDPNIVGRELLFSLRPHTVVGVMPPGYRYPVDANCEYFVPLASLVPQAVENRGAHFLRCVGRLKPGASVNQASAEVAGIAGRLQKQYPDTDSGRSGYAISLQDDVVGDVRPALLTVVAAVFLVLLIACANVANLLLARATQRRREIAIRTALGASRAQVIRQLLAEGSLLALLGAFAGLLLASWGIDLLRTFGPADIPRLHEIRMNGVVIAFTLGLTIFSTLVFAIFPAVQVSRPNVNDSLQEGNRGAVGPESHRMRGLLVVAQVALSMLLLAAAGLLIKSFGNLRATNPGFESSHVWTVNVALPRAKYSDNAIKQRDFFARLEAKLKALPGVEATGSATPLAFSGNDRASSFWIAGQPDPGLGNHPNASHLVVDGGYFRALRIPLLAGRTFDGRDTPESAPVILVNQAFVRRFFPTKNPIGEHILIDASEKEKPVSREIIGVVGSTRHESLAVAPIPEYYVPFGQDPDRRADVVLRTASDKLLGLESAVGNSIRQIDRDVYVPELKPLENMIGTTLAQPRFNMMLLGVFAGIAMLLAAIGIYGVMAYSVAQRTREIGIRMALGAQRGDMLGMILRQSFKIVGTGLVIGLVGAFFTTRLMASLLYGVGAQDISIFAIVLTVLTGAALLATYMPARRAMRVDPIVALRYE